MVAYEAVRVLDFVIYTKYSHKGTISYVDNLNNSVEVTLDEPLTDVVGNKIRTLHVFDPEGSFRTPLGSVFPRLENRTAIIRAFDEAERDAERLETRRCDDKRG